MKLNERIYTLRTARKMSQGDLAEALGISRQSISKWETGTAVPEIDNLVRLSEIFGITLDELIKGEDVPSSAPARNENPPTVVVYREREPRKTAALVLLLCGIVSVLLAFLGLGGIGILIAVPLFVCALICVLCRRRVGLWCAWAVLLLVNLLLMLSTGVMNAWWGYLRMVLAGHQPVAGGTIQIIVSVLLTLWEVGMIVATVLSYRQAILAPSLKRLISVIGGWVALIAVRVAMGVFSSLELKRFEEGLQTGTTVRLHFWRFLNVSEHFFELCGFTAILVLTLALIRGHRSAGRDTH